MPRSKRRYVLECALRAKAETLWLNHVPPHAEQYAVEVKNVDRFEILHQLRAFWPRQAKPALLIAAPYITAQMAERCREWSCILQTPPAMHTSKRQDCTFMSPGSANPTISEPLKKARSPTQQVSGWFLPAVQARFVEYHLSRDCGGCSRRTGDGWTSDEGTGNSQAYHTAARGRTNTTKVLKRLVQEWVAVYPTVLRPKDRKHEKRDAADIHTLLKEYGDAGNEDRLYGEELNVLEAEGYDFELAGARLIGRDAALVISPDTNRVRDILQSEPLMAELTNQIILLSVRNDSEYIRRQESLVSKLRHGFLSAE